MRTLGVDLAARPPGTACCTVSWGGGRARLERLVAGGATDDVVLELMAEADLTGVDSPVGWPDAFVRTVGAWSAGGHWTQPADPAELTLRLTDRYVAARVRHPLSVSADKIAVVAFRCAAILDRFEQFAGPAAVDRSGTGGRVAEVYPAAALLRWSWFGHGAPVRDRRPSYKRAAGRPVRVRLVDALTARLPWLDLAGHAPALVDSDDAFDALVAALVARAVALGLTEPPTDLDVARREGWIHVPDPGTLDALARSAD